MDLYILLIGGAVFGAVILLVAYAVTTAESKLTGRANLKAIENYTWQGEEVVAEQPPLSERVIGPVFAYLLRLGKKFTPIGYVDSCRTKLMLAGRRGADEVDRYLAIRALTVALIPVSAVLIIGVLRVPGGKGLMMVALLALALGIGPDAYLNKAAEARQKKIRQSLPDLLDLLTISVEAGLGFEQAIDRISEAVPGPLSDEFTRMLGEMRAGSSRSDALLGLETRTGVDEVKSFVLAMVQADQFGISIGRVLRAQADEMRIKRRQMAQEAAQKAPVKMLLPMTFFIFPALFVVVLGPAAVQIIDNLS